MSQIGHGVSQVCGGTEMTLTQRAKWVLWSLLLDCNKPLQELQ
jgi:hypothetical protein